ncbi:MAG: hypothetical protein IT369_24280 [Candidatus Latescibacteria bacterium]|nr:hypothetical protein [Candidatus Latescibacterota bacterium]
MRQTFCACLCFCLLSCGLQPTTAPVTKAVAGLRGVAGEALPTVPDLPATRPLGGPEDELIRRLDAPPELMAPIRPRATARLACCLRYNDARHCPLYALLNSYQI